MLLEQQRSEFQMNPDNLRKYKEDILNQTITHIQSSATLQDTFNSIIQLPEIAYVPSNSTLDVQTIKQDLFNGITKRYLAVSNSSFRKYLLDKVLSKKKEMEHRKKVLVESNNLKSSKKTTSKLYDANKDNIPSTVKRSRKSSTWHDDFVSLSCLSDDEMDICIICKSSQTSSTAKMIQCVTCSSAAHNLCWTNIPTQTQKNFIWVQMLPVLQAFIDSHYGNAC